jgi:hypothetical protein
MAVVGIDIGGTRQGLGKDALIQAVPDFAGVQTTISPARGENRAQHAGAASLPEEARPGGPGR